MGSFGRAFYSNDRISWMHACNLPYKMNKLTDLLMRFQPKNKAKLGERRLELIQENLLHRKNWLWLTEANKPQMFLRLMRRPSLLLLRQKCSMIVFLSLFAIVCVDDFLFLNWFQSSQSSFSLAVLLHGISDYTPNISARCILSQCSPRGLGKCVPLIIWYRPDTPKISV